MFLSKHTGYFGFIKPWTAVRDIETFSLQFLTPSAIEGIEKKLFPELLGDVGIKRIIRHRLTYSGISKQQEQTQPRGIKQKPQKINKSTKLIEISRPKSILNRGVLVNPILYLAFNEKIYAERASKQHICLCRNEDLLFPVPFEWEKYNYIKEVSIQDFDDHDGDYKGFELSKGKNKKSFIVGYNRFKNNEPMYGWINIVGSNPLHKNTM